MIDLAKLFSWEESLAAELFTNCRDAAEILTELSDFVANLGSKLPASEYLELAPGVFAHRSAKIHPSSYLGGPSIIGPQAELRYNVYLRGPAIIDAKVCIANAGEIKNAILLKGATCPHYNYVGDSIVGRSAHLGAGVICSNLRSDGQAVKIPVANEYWLTGRRKFGALIGDEVEIGCQSVLNPGTVLGPRTRVYPLTSVLGVHAADSLIGKRPEEGRAKL
ncbi:MAG: UDP-N-acetylglucosamine pyrophosphorylase [Eubacteriales bacterium]|nr:UDP-N-acetylglucosamine pyrophosphorylase [Eubacteriales bacterium]